MQWAPRNIQVCSAKGKKAIISTEHSDTNSIIIAARMHALHNRLLSVHILQW